MVVQNVKLVFVKTSSKESPFEKDLIYIKYGKPKFCVHFFGSCTAISLVHANVAAPRDKNRQGTKNKSLLCWGHHWVLLAPCWQPPVPLHPSDVREQAVETDLREHWSRGQEGILLRISIEHYFRTWPLELWMASSWRLRTHPVIRRLSISQERKRWLARFQVCASKRTCSVKTYCFLGSGTACLVDMTCLPLACCYWRW